MYLRQAESQDKTTFPLQTLKKLFFQQQRGQCCIIEKPYLCATSFLAMTFEQDELTRTSEQDELTHGPGGLELSFFVCTCGECRPVCTRRPNYSFLSLIVSEIRYFFGEGHFF